MEYANLNVVLRDTPKEHLAAVVVSTFSLNAHRFKAVARAGRLPLARTVVLHHRNSTNPQHLAHYPTIRAYRWNRGAERYYHYRFVLFLYTGNRPCRFIVYSRNLNRFHVSGRRELLYTGTPTGLRMLITTVASLLRGGAFDPNDGPGQGIQTPALLQMLDNAVIQYHPAADRILVQRPQRSTLAQLRHYRRQGGPACAIDVYAPYQADALDICPDIADALVTQGAARVVVARPSIDHGFELGSVVRRRGPHPLFVYTTHNLTDASWIGHRTLEISVITQQPPAVQVRVNQRMQAGDEVEIDETNC